MINKVQDKDKPELIRMFFKDVGTIPDKSQNTVSKEELGESKIWECNKILSIDSKEIEMYNIYKVEMQKIRSFKIVAKIL